MWHIPCRKQRHKNQTIISYGLVFIQCNRLLTTICPLFKSLNCVFERGADWSDIVRNLLYLRILQQLVPYLWVEQSTSNMFGNYSPFNKALHYSPSLASDFQVAIIGLPQWGRCQQGYQLGQDNVPVQYTYTMHYWLENILYQSSFRESVPVQLQITCTFRVKTLLANESVNSVKFCEISGHHFWKDSESQVIKMS